MLFQKSEHHYNKSLWSIWLLVFLQLFFSEMVFAGLGCRLAGTQEFIHSDPAAAGEYFCFPDFYGTRLRSVEFYSGNREYAQYQIQCDNNLSEFAGKEIGADCLADGFFANGEFVEKDDQNSTAGGMSCPKKTSDGPINLITGNKYKIHTDIDALNSSSTIQRPSFTRIYNSQSSSQHKTEIGVNWLHSYQRRLVLIDLYHSEIHDATNKNHSTLYNSLNNACVSGFEELRINSNNPDDVSQDLLKLVSGSSVPVWTDEKCEIHRNGQYIGTLPVKTDVDPSWISISNDASTIIKALRPDGNEYTFTKPLGPITDTQQWIADSSNLDIQLEHFHFLTRPGNTTVSNYFYYLTDENNIVEKYNDDGLLVRIDYPNGINERLTYDGVVTNQINQVYNNVGNTLDFIYDIDGQIKTITDDAGRVWQYQYISGRLVKVINPDLTEKNYHYENTNYPDFLTGLTDERSIRYSTFGYNSDGKAESSYLGTPTTSFVNRISNVTVDYSGTGFNVVTDSRGFDKKYHYSSDVIQNVMTQFDGPECNNCAGGSKQYDYDINLADPTASTLNLLSKTEYGQTTNYSSYDVKGNPGAITNAVGTTEEILKTYEYDSRYQSKISKITEPSVFAANYKTTDITYDDFANISSVVSSGFDNVGNAISRTQTFTYDGPFHQLSKIDGARTDINDWTLMDYYADDPLQGNNRARMRKMTAPLGIILYNNIAYTATGQMSSYDSANNLQVGFTYYAGNDRLETITQTDTVTNTSHTARFTYLATGEVTSITTGDGTADATTVTLEYDIARRLTRVYDGLGNYIEYTLDTEGNITNESILDSTGILKKALNETFDAYNRSNITTQVNETFDIDYSPDGTLDLTLDGKGTVSDYSYDSLLRLTSINQDQAGTNPETANALTQLGYDVQDNLTSVIDPINGATTYIYDDLGNMTSQSSPDTGTTSYAHDEAGNITGMIDAKGQGFTYSYDAQNRLLLVDAPSTEFDILYLYDSCTNGLGRLCQVSNQQNTVDYVYNVFGDVISHQTVTYTYDSASRLSSMTYPSGAVLSYEYDGAGRVSNVRLNNGGVITALASNILYKPFGEVESFLFGSTKALNRDVDLAYRTTTQNVADVLLLDYPIYDANGNIEQIVATESVSITLFEPVNNAVTRKRNHGNPFKEIVLKVFTHVSEHRLGSSHHTFEKPHPIWRKLRNFFRKWRHNWRNVGAGDGSDPTGGTDPTAPTEDSVVTYDFSYDALNRLDTANGSFGALNYDYDINGNRIVLTTDGVASAYSYEAASNRAVLLADQAVTLDSNGNVTVQGNRTFSYTPHNQLLSVSENAASIADEYTYNGLGQRSSKTIGAQRTSFSYGLDGLLLAETSGGVTKEYYYLNGQLLAMTYGSTANIAYIHNDHLGTPKAITNEAGVKIWSAKHNPFGLASVNEDVDGDGNSVELNVRFAGQYYDKETQLHYNYFRYYDPSTGRYITSDPIGLAGGLNTFAYVGGNPLGFVDPLGLLVKEALVILTGAAVIQSVIFFSALPDKFKADQASNERFEEFSRGNLNVDIEQDQDDQHNRRVGALKNGIDANSSIKKFKLGKSIENLINKIKSCF